MMPSITVRGSGVNVCAWCTRLCFIYLYLGFCFVFDPPCRHRRVSFPPGRVKTNGERLVDIIIYTTLYRFEYYKRYQMRS